MRQNKTIQPPHPLIRAVHHLLISNHLEQNTRLWSALATALLEGTWKTVFVFPVQQVVFVLLVQWTHPTSHLVIGRCIICLQARYHLPGEKNPLLIWFCCEFSFGAGIPRKSASKYGAPGLFLSFWMRLIL